MSGQCCTEERWRDNGWGEGEVTRETGGGGGSRAGERQLQGEKQVGAGLNISIYLIE